ncbi:MAG: carbamate kinase [Anaerolineae bacterium]|nr:carbamate kinase [Promineifilum sp.]MCZ2115323.1 carbamate kinase [Anaerolineae bacterium]
MNGKLAVIAIGGNSLIKDKQHQSVEDQYQAAHETAGHIARMVKDGWNVAIAHGNGPQVGFILRRSELASHELHEVPLDVCGADSQGAIGYALQQSLQNHFLDMGIDRAVATIVTQTEVSADDPAFKNPTKPIGSFMDEEEAMKRRERDGWDVVEDAGRGWRRVVASPIPTRIVEEPSVRALIAAGQIVITVGGGGIPVVADEKGHLHGIAAVIDKDFASSLLATKLGADTFIISTAVEKVAINFGKPDQQWLDKVTLAEAKAYLEEGKHFAKGSMAPKIQAIINFLEAGGTHAIVTDPPNIPRALAGETGTHFVR